MSLPPIYRPGDLDEDVYGPFMGEPRPEWDTAEDEEREQAFLKWAIEALDEFEPHDFREWQKQSESRWTVWMMQQELDDEPALSQARQILPFLTLQQFRLARFGREPPKPRQRPGKTPEARIAAAAADWFNLTQLFLQNFGKKHRRLNPKREEIIVKKYSLTHDEWDRVQNMVRKSRRL